MIREARYADAGALSRLLATSWAEMPYGHIPIDRRLLARSLHEHLTGGEESFAAVSEVRGEVKGTLLARWQPLLVAQGSSTTDIAFVCRSGEGRGLVRAYVEWARGMGTSIIGLSVSSDNERAGRLFERCGFEFVGGNYQLREHLE